MSPVRALPRAPGNQKYTSHQLALIVKESIFVATTPDHAHVVFNLERRLGILFTPCRSQLTLPSQDTCVDVQHKKRGRPPLKSDDSATRTISEPESATEAQRGSFAGSSQPGPQPYSYPYQRPSIAPRDMVPQAAGQQGGIQRPHVALAPSPYGMYAPPSVGSSYATASGTTYNPAAQRPPSSSSSLPSSQPPSPYYQTPSAGRSPEQQFPRGRGYRGSYSGQASPQEFYPPITGSYNVSLFPRTSVQQQGLFEVPASLYTPQQSIAPELQLPPIRPAPPGAYTDPAMAQQQQRQAQQQHQEREGRAAGRPGDNGTTRQPDPKRPRMSLGNIVNPRND
ncbi:hypothetical protein EPUS_00503 [Endocarpon pusillum Z07020]|uniref:Uncharacterized protein n=1 Tax=Endocarpon pusillum (strain Z07020 / HMAS-L-300199) TaxID=1263415 RepID=U1HQY0_ENDPU|nr:uncharacterized protein EPUS_00503 [Endocarpon pusillum Z07020]ERF71514.1 hypothetical protein EPUS_00503 [Endocarpon pusillum Z07020]